MPTSLTRDDVKPNTPECNSGPDTRVISLVRRGKKPLRFQGEAARRTRLGNGDDVTLWHRRDGRLSVSMTVGDRQDAVVATNLEIARHWVEAQCVAPPGESPCPANALDALAAIEEWLKETRFYERAAQLAGAALFDWPSPTLKTGGNR